MFFQRKKTCSFLNSHHSTFTIQSLMVHTSLHTTESLWFIYLFASPNFSFHYTLDLFITLSTLSVSSILITDVLLCPLAVAFGSMNTAFRLPRMSTFSNIFKEILCNVSRGSWTIITSGYFREWFERLYDLTCHFLFQFSTGYAIDV